jgi:hypothetical protein
MTGVTRGVFTRGLSMIYRVMSTTLGVIGGVVGGVFGFVLFFWIIKQGFYALVVPGACVGLGCSLLARHRSVPRGVACAIAALLLGLYTEWRYESFALDDRFSYLVTHFYLLRPITLIMIGLGTALAFYLGKDAGFLAPRREGVLTAKGDARQTRDLHD